MRKKKVPSTNLDTKAIVLLIKQEINSGKFYVGSRLPSLRDGAEIFRCHRNTVAKAYKILAKENLVEVQLSRGFYVKESSIACDYDPAKCPIYLAVSALFYEGITIEEIGTLFKRAIAIVEA